MIDSYRFGSITVAGATYTKDLRIVGRQVLPDWRRQAGHLVTARDMAEILDQEPNILIIGTGKLGMMRIHDSLQNACRERNIELIAQPTKSAVTTFNRQHDGTALVAAGFHLTC